MIRRISLTILAVAGILFGSFSQQREYSGFFDSYYYRGPFSITLGGGATAFNGDIGSFAKPSPSYAFNIGASYKPWPKVAFGAEILYFQLKGSKVKDSSYAATFSSTNIELDLYARYYLIDDIIRVARDRSKKPKPVKPYITAGIGFLSYKPTASYNFNNVLLNNTSTTSGIALNIPVGIGAAFRISNRTSILAEVAYHYAFSDNLDGVKGGTYKDSYIIACLRLQYSPFAKAKKKKSKASSAPEQYNGPKGTETWKNKKEREKAQEPAPEPLPGEEQPQNNTEETPADQQQEQNDQQQQNNDNQENKDNSPVPQVPEEKSR